MSVFGSSGSAKQSPCDCAQLRPTIACRSCRSALHQDDGPVVSVTGATTNTLDSNSAYACILASLVPV